ncbi:MAG: hypothetical protein GC153_05415 [Alphaproteobacteria bacterium]|nr:hypothetical protein [Alphaproteobacteria bacterium]
MIAKFTLAGIAALTLGACVSVLPKAPPPAPRFLIEPVAFGDEQGPRVGWSLIVEDPNATRVYDTTKIALLRQPGQVEYYANGEWADRAPRLFQTALIRSFENSGRILNVGDPATLTGADFVLQTDIRAMNAVYDGGGAPTAVFAVYARLADRTGKAVAARLFDEQVAASADEIDDIASAFDQAIEAALKEMTAWTFDEAGGRARSENDAAPETSQSTAPSGR